MQKRGWKLTDSLKEKIVELAKKDAQHNVYMGNEFMNLRKAEVSKVAPNRAALIGKLTQFMSGNMSAMKEVEEADKEDTEGVKIDSFEHHVNRMAAAYNKMKNGIEEKYASEDYEPEYYVTESGKIEELTKEKELDMLNQAYENHSDFMATSTEIWSELQDFTPTVTYHKGGGQAEQEQSKGEGKEIATKPETKGVIKNAAYQAFLSAIQPDNQKLSQQYSGDWKDLRLNLNVSDGDRKILNGIWDYYANKR